MAVSLRASKEGLEIVDRIRKNKGWTKTEEAWYQLALTSKAALKRFWRRTPITQEHFVGLCKAVGIKNWEEIVDDTPVTQANEMPAFSQYDASWVGREQLVENLTQRLRGSCRLLLIVGLTGIGKTALAEKLAVELQDWFQGDWNHRFIRANFDYPEKPTDFTSVAKQWLEELGEKLSLEDSQPEELLERLVKHFRENKVLILIDSLETLLTETEEEGWGDFGDDWWAKLFLRLLSAESCQSRFIVTSQDLPIQLSDRRYQNFCDRQILYGLEESEQIALFDTEGLDVSAESPDRPLLLRLGKVYKGHPLVLRVIIGEICESFEGNVQAYWNEIASKIEEVETAIAEAEADANKIIGADDEWKLHKLTRKVRLQVNKQRLQSVLDRLETQVRDAYILLCAGSVYRLPVQKQGWLMQLVNLIKHLEKQNCSADRQERALEELENRFLVEVSVNHNNKRLLGQHNLVRSIALDRYQKLMQDLRNGAKSA